MDAWQDDDLRALRLELSDAADELAALDLGGLAAAEIEISPELRVRINATSERVVRAERAYRQRQEELGLL